MEITTHDAGQIQTVMNFSASAGAEKDQYAVEAYTRKNEDRIIIGFWKSLLARTFSSTFKHGSLMHIEKAAYARDSVNGIIITPFGNFYYRSKVQDGKIQGTLQNGKHEVVGYVSGTKGMPKLPLRDYNALTKEVLATASSKLYDPALLQQPQWQEFSRQMTKLSSKVQDDAAYEMGFFYYAGKLPFSHFYLFRLQENAGQNMTPDRNVETAEKGAGTLYMKISSFSGSAQEMDSTFNAIAKKNYNTLIVDLRDNPGGSIEAGMPFMQHLIPDSITGGVFLTQKYFAAHKELPKPAEYNRFRHFSDASYDLLISGIWQYPAMCLVAKPKAPKFNGKVYILVNGNTASTCEPIVYLMKEYHLATIVGEKTAGAMLNGEHFKLRDGFTMVIPTATYYTADGYKIDRNGVQPDVPTKSDAALDYVLQKK